MTKITLNELGSLTNQSTAINSINNNSQIIEEAFDNTLSRDGTEPNHMMADLDMDSNRILNLPEAASELEPVRQKEFRLAQLGDYELSANLDSIDGVTDLGYLAHTAPGVYAVRELIGTANEVTVTNGGGGAGDTTISLPVSIDLTGKTVSSGTISGTGIVGSTITGSTINGSANTMNVRLNADVSGNLPVTNLNAGTGATTTTYWAGDGTWKTPAAVPVVSSIAELKDLAVMVWLFFLKMVVQDILNGSLELLQITMLKIFMKGFT